MAGPGCDPVQSISRAASFARGHSWSHRILLREICQDLVTVYGEEVSCGDNGIFSTDAGTLDGRHGVGWVF